MRHLFGAMDSGVSWQPSDLSGLQLWLDASDASTITDAGGGAVSQWSDKSGNAHHFTQPVAGNRPTTGTRTQNGLNVIDFVRASAQFLDGGDVLDLGANAFSIFGVVKFDDTTSSTLWGKHLVGTTDGRYGMARLSGSLYSIYDSDASATGFVTVTDSSTSARLLGQVLTRNGASSSNVLHRGATTDTTSFTDTATSWNISHPWRIGRYSTWTSFDLDGFVGEIIMLLRAATSDEVTAIKNYLTTKWAV